MVLPGIVSLGQSLYPYSLQLSDALDELRFHSASAYCDLGADLGDVTWVRGSIGIEGKPALDGATPLYEFVGEYRAKARDRFNNVSFDIPGGFYAEGSERHLPSVTDAVDPRPTDLVSLQMLLHLEVPLFVVKLSQHIALNTGQCTIRRSGA